MPDHQQTMQLITKAKNGDESSKTELLTQNSPLIKSIIKRFKNKGVAYDDLYQLGCLGFVKAVNKFDLSYNVRFSTYAVPLIAGEVKRFLRDDGYIKVSRAVKALYIKIKKEINEYSILNGDSPSIKYLAEKLETCEEDIVYAMEASKYPISISEKPTNSQGGEDSLSLLDRLPDGESQEKTVDLLMLKNKLKLLKPREQKIIMLRFFRNLTQSEVASRMGVSQVQISRIEAKVLKELKEYFILSDQII